MTEIKQDMRRFPRVEAEQLISVRPAAGAGGVLTISRIVGLGGLMFETGERTRAGKKMAVELLDGTDIIRLPARVAWCRSNRPGNWRVGVEFIGVTEAEREKLLDLLLRRVHLREEMVR